MFDGFTCCTVPKVEIISSSRLPYLNRNIMERDFWLQIGFSSPKPKMGTSCSGSSFAHPLRSLSSCTVERPSSLARSHSLQSHPRTLVRLSYFQLDLIAANGADYAVNEDIDGGFALRIRRGGYFAKIGGSSQSFPARLVVAYA